MKLLKLSAVSSTKFYLYQSNSSHNAHDTGINIC